MRAAGSPSVSFFRSRRLPGTPCSTAAQASNAASVTFDKRANDANVTGAPSVAGGGETAGASAGAA